MKIDIDKIHTTALGAERIRRNLALAVDDVVEWCKNEIENADSSAITRRGKNWYVYGKDYVLTINAYSYTIITGHKR
ncbi:MAG: DUF3781 domain-containing protein [Spirochaetaceae bacterium]|jgi:hypothetical protein|nr:DUF3781 domain-containing protein [Spirochaetaceae bacterium]